MGVCIDAYAPFNVHELHVDPVYSLMFQAGCEVAVLHSGFVVFDNPGFKHNKL